jgi:hypothetical protein
MVLHTLHRRTGGGGNDLLRWILVASIVLLSSFTLSNLKHFQNIMDFLSASDAASFHTIESAPLPPSKVAQRLSQQAMDDNNRQADTTTRTRTRTSHPQPEPHPHPHPPLSKGDGTPGNLTTTTTTNILSSSNNDESLIETQTKSTETPSPRNESSSSSSSPSIQNNNSSNNHNINITSNTNENPPIDDGLPCLVHGTMEIHAEARRVSDPNKTRLEHHQVNNNNNNNNNNTNTNNNTATACGRLRRDWRYHAPRSRLAKLLEAHQTDCGLPLATHNMDNTYGFGSHLALWGQALCNAREARYRMRSHCPMTITTTTGEGRDWIWLDQEHCDTSMAQIQSPMRCYFPNAEYRCDGGGNTNTTNTNTNTNTDNNKGEEDPISNYNATDPRNIQKWCKLVKESDEMRAEYRAASTEYLFQRVGDIVIQEAKRQLGIVFQEYGGVAPSDLITVHIRWGDKFWEMNLPSIQEYIDAVRSLLSRHTDDDDSDSDVNIYLATEDPKAYQEFLRAKPENWKVHADITLQEINAFRPVKGNRASWATKNTKGRAGLVALGSLLVAMEANRFVLTTKSNWSTLMNHLRMNILDPDCGNCTRHVDLRPGLW